MSANVKAEDLKIIDKIMDGDYRSGARAITRIENCDEDVVPVIQALYKTTSPTVVIGITGAPGSGKSTLVDQLVERFRSLDQTVAVLAIDPSSPFSGGAVLGDRIRMSRHDKDKGVFIRSMAARGQLGGMALAAADAITVLRAMRWDVILIETVGVGQNETDVMRYADTVLLTLTPETGDEVQTVKAGVMEIADVFVINKADHPGTEKLVRSLKELNSFHANDGAFLPEIIQTQATIGAGVDDLVVAVRNHIMYLATDQTIWRRRKTSQLKHHILNICTATITKTINSDYHLSKFNSDLEALIDRRTDPYTVAEMVRNQL